MGDGLTEVEQKRIEDSLEVASKEREQRLKEGWLFNYKTIAKSLSFPNIKSILYGNMYMKFIYIMNG